MPRHTLQLLTSSPGGGARGPGWGVRVVRGVGWTLIATGVLILLYLVYLIIRTMGSSRD